MAGWFVPRLVVPIVLGLLAGLPVPFAPAQAVRAASPCVTPDGSGGCAASIQGGINAASDGETITVAANTTSRPTYNEHVYIYKNVTIRGAGASTTIVDGTNSGSVFTILGNITARIEGLTIQHGQARFGGGIYMVDTFNSSAVTLSGVILSGNAASIGGGGIYGSGGSTVTVNTSTVRGNTAFGEGGGIFNQGVVTVTDSTFSGNAVSQGDGGGIFNNATLTVTNSTFSGNSAFSDNLSGAQGGGIFNNVGRLTLTNSTLSGNSAGQGGGLFQSGGSANVAESIIAANTATIEPDVHGGITSGGYNLIGTTDGSTGFGGTDIAGTGAHPVDPLLGPLADNGGPTQTLPLRPGSPAIDRLPASGAGCPPADQRGISRPQGPACDIGAFEAVPATLPVSLAPATLPDGTPGLPYTQTFTATGGNGTGYTFTVSAGALPPGLTLSGAGVLSGTPTMKGTYRFTVRATNSGGNSGEREYTLVIGPSPPLPVREPTGRAAPGAPAVPAGGSGPHSVPSGR